MNRRYEGDPRLYLRFRPDSASRFYVQCLAESEDDPHIRCQFRQREDAFRANLARGSSHTCLFRKRDSLATGQLTLEELSSRRVKESTIIYPNLALFLALECVGPSYLRRIFSRSPETSFRAGMAEPCSISAARDNNGTGRARVDSALGSNGSLTGSH
jgi:hypothetical protein